jgi:hypothetical protein
MKDLSVMEKAILNYLRSHPEGVKTENISDIFHLKTSVVDDAIIKIHEYSCKIGSDGTGRVWIA